MKDVIKNSYIFVLKDNIKSKTRSRLVKNNDLNYSLMINNPINIFRNLLLESFEDFTQKEDLNKELLGKFKGSFSIEVKSKKIKINFVYSEVFYNYYLDVFFEDEKHLPLKSKIQALQELNSLFITKNNDFRKKFFSILAYDYVSEYYGNLVFKDLNKLERKLKKALYMIYSLSFNPNNYKDIDELLEPVGVDSKQIKCDATRMKKEQSLEKDEAKIRNLFSSFTHSDFENFLFKETTYRYEKDEVVKFLQENNDLTVIDDDVIRNKIDLIIPKTNYDRFFSNKKMVKDFKKMLQELREFRNDVFHCKVFYDEAKFKRNRKLICEALIYIDEVILKTESSDFFNKNIELALKNTSEFFKDF